MLNTHNSAAAISYPGDTVLLKSKLTLETRTSRLDPRASMLEKFDDRVSSLEDRVPRIEKQGFLEYAKA